MFAYCLNAPTVYIDERGCFPGIVDELFTMREKQDNAPGLGESVFLSMNEAAIAAGYVANIKTHETDLEHQCGIYEINVFGATLYYHGKIMSGYHSMSDQSDIYAESALEKGRLVALLHTHPYCNGHIGETFSMRTSNGALTGDALVVREDGYPSYLVTPSGNLLLLPVFFGENIPEPILIASGLPVDTTIISCY